MNSSGTFIKYTAGDTVYWLNSGGFTRGIVKSVSLRDHVSIHNGVLGKHTKEINFYLWSNGSVDEYQGDCVPEHLIFQSYDDMFNYYDRKGRTL